jgi:hypothetical protein
MRRIRLISGQHTAVASGKLMCGRDQSNSDRQAITDYHLSCSIPLAGFHMLKLVFSSAHFVL